MGDDRTNLAAKYRRERNTAGLIALCLVCAGLFAGLVFAAWRLGNGGAEAVPGAGAIRGALAIDPDRAAVKAWLDGNLDDGDYEIAKWYPAATLQGAKVFAHRNTYLASNPRGIDGLWNPVKEQGTAVRVKYRYKNRLGGPMLDDSVFLLDSSGVVERLDARDFRFPGESIAAYLERVDRGR